MNQLPGLGVSGSEALAISTCERKWMYQFHPGYDLEPVSHSTAITRGLIGHNALEVFFSSIQAGEDFEMAKKKSIMSMGMASMEAAANDDFASVVIIDKLRPQIDRYLDGNKNVFAQWEILGTELLVRAPLPDTDLVHLVGKMDIMIKWRNGQYKGETAPVDHKLVYNFWTEKSFLMNAQLPQYAVLGRIWNPDAVIPRSWVNQVRWRECNTEMWKISPLPEDKIYTASVLNNHTRVSLKVLEYKNMPVEPVQEKATRSISKYSCENCGFLTICRAEMKKQDTTDIRKHEYRGRTYGYDLIADEE